MSSSIAVFGAAVIFGYFILPLLLSKEKIGHFLSHTTDSESAWRDHLLKFMTDFMEKRLYFITPNFVSYIGFLLIGYLVYLFESGANSVLIFTVILVAGFTDMLDGSLARNSNRITKLGVVLDVSRDALLAVVIGFYLVSYNLLSDYLLFWFLIGYTFLGVIRVFEFKLASGKIFSLEEDYKFVLDRVRLTLAWIGALLLILVPYSISLYTIAETLIIASIACSCPS